MNKFQLKEFGVKKFVEVVCFSNFEEVKYSDKFGKS